MDTQRVKVFHAGYCEAMVVSVADHFKFDFFPAFQRFFYQNLFRESKGAFSQFQEFFFVGTDTATKTTQCISRTYHDRITDSACSSNGIFHVFYCLANRSLHLDFVQFLHEQITVFCIHDSFYRCTKHLYSVFISLFIPWFWDQVQEYPVCRVPHRNSTQFVRRMPARYHQDVLS